MKSKRYRIYLLVFAVVMILLALFAESVYFSDFEYKLRTKKFIKVLSEKEIIIENCLNSLKEQSFFGYRKPGYSSGLFRQ
jgi:hypothetical protein